MTDSETDAYRRLARWYDSIFGRMNAGLRGIAMKMWPPRAGMEVLDVGCGTGIQLSAYQEAGCRVWGIDTSPSMLGVARRRLGDRAHLDLGDGARMPYPDRTFDLILAATVLHEIMPDTRASVLSELNRAVRSDGRILLVDFEPGPIHSVRGWTTKAVIAVSELAAGGRHHRNYRDFMARGGLTGCVAANGFSAAQRKMVSGGAIGLYLLLPKDERNLSKP